MKAVIDPDHIPLNKFTLSVAGLPDITFLTISGLERVLDVVDLPDRTVASGGRTQAQEFTVTVPMHHTQEIAAMQSWLEEAKDPALPTYKKLGTLRCPSLSDQNAQTYQLIDLFVASEVVPDFDFDNDGEMAAVEFLMRASDMLAI